MRMSEVTLKPIYLMLPGEWGHQIWQCLRQGWNLSVIYIIYHRFPRPGAETIHNLGKIKNICGDVKNIGKKSAA